MGGDVALSPPVIFLVCVASLLIIMLIMHYGTC